MLAYGTTAVTLWWLGLALFFLAVVPLIVVVANRVVRPLRQIRDYAHDILEHAPAIADNLGARPGIEGAATAAERAAGNLKRSGRGAVGTEPGIERRRPA